MPRSSLTPPAVATAPWMTRSHLTPRLSTRRQRHDAPRIRRASRSPALSSISPPSSPRPLSRFPENTANPSSSSRRRCRRREPPRSNRGLQIVSPRPPLHPHRVVLPGRPAFAGNHRFRLRLRRAQFRRLPPCRAFPDHADLARDFRVSTRICSTSSRSSPCSVSSPRSTASLASAAVRHCSVSCLR